MNKEEIMNVLPHRDDMLLLDEVKKEGETAFGYYKVTGQEFFLKGHFPGNPIVPGVILCEILAQSACVLLADQITKDKTPMYTGLNNVKFRNPVKPGDTIQTEVVLTRVRPPFYTAKGKVTVEGKLCVSAEFSFAVV